jgi:hypothetical protein
MDSHGGYSTLSMVFRDQWTACVHEAKQEVARLEACGLHGDVPAHDAGSGHDHVVCIEGHSLLRLKCDRLRLKCDLPRTKESVVLCIGSVTGVVSGTVLSPVGRTSIGLLTTDEAEVLEASLADDVVTAGCQTDELFAQWVRADLEIHSASQAIRYHRGAWGILCFGLLLRCVGIVEFVVQDVVVVLNVQVGVTPANRPNHSRIDSLLKSRSYTLVARHRIVSLVPW